jgi:hypothetical protein
VIEDDRKSLRGLLRLVPTATWSGPCCSSVGRIR